MGFLYFIVSSTRLTFFLPILAMTLLPFHVESSKRITKHVHNHVCPNWKEKEEILCNTTKSEVAKVSRVWEANYKDATKYGQLVKQYALSLEKADCGKHPYPVLK